MGDPTPQGVPEDISGDDLLPRDPVGAEDHGRVEIHKPKAVRGWREFFNEIGVIVIGVLIALAAEQAVESWHWRVEASEARSALRSEVRDDALPQAYARLAISHCIDAQLQGLQDALDHAADRRRIATLVRAYVPPLRTWDDQAWQAVVATGALSHGGAEELIRWSRPYRLIVVLGPTNLAEHADVLNLRSISGASGQLTQLERDRVTVALEHLRADEEQMVRGSKTLLAGAADAGVVMTPAQERRVMEQLHPRWGTCLKTPRWLGVDPDTQSDQQFLERANGS